jgi:purine-binding chemotaxis protein CheW
MVNEENMSQLALLQPPAPDTHHTSFAAALPTLTFIIGTQEYGLPVADVLEIVPVPAMLRLVGTPAYLVGVLNRRGRHLAVLDGRILVGEPAQYDLNRYIIIAGRAADNMEQVIAPCGLLVDQVCDVRVLEPESLAPFSKGAAASFLWGIARWTDRSLLLFGFEELLALAPAISKGVGPA